MTAARGVGVMPLRVLLHLEGLALLVAAVVVYVEIDASWILFAVLFLAPDVSFLGYLAGPRVGAAAYNALHTAVVPVALAVFALLADAENVLAVALVWLAHIGVDRAIGYGLKYPTALRDTHLQRV